MEHPKDVAAEKRERAHQRRRKALPVRKPDGDAKLEATTSKISPSTKVTNVSNPSTWAAPGDMEPARNAFLPHPFAEAAQELSPDYAGTAQIFQIVVTR